MERTRSVSRCVAVAAHGRRCRQSPFRGSPYCWHHTQSRKVWAPSRLMAGTGGMRLVVDDPTSAGAAEAILGHARAATGRGAMAHEGLDAGARLARALGPERTAELMRFLEDPERASFTIEKRDPAADGLVARAGRATA